MTRAKSIAEGLDRPTPYRQCLSLRAARSGTAGKNPHDDCNQKVHTTQDPDRKTDLTPIRVIVLLRPAPSACAAIWASRAGRLMA